ncbi:MAG: ATP-binding protein [Saprospiraceae bacterium]|nr:ATP-binding protein [Saprospiraceae bacterium]
MLTLKEVKIAKYKSYLETQVVSIEDKITTLVGKNESGKTAFLEAIAKFNYFEKDPKFQFDVTADYPRNELKKYQRDNEPVEVIKCTFEISDELLEEISDDLGADIFKIKSFSYGIKYDGNNTWYDLSANEEVFFKNYIKEKEFSAEATEELKGIKSVKALESLFGTTQNEEVKKLYQELKKEYIDKAYKWDNVIKGYIAKNYLEPNFPKFWYFDEYFSLPSRVNINRLQSNQTDAELTAEALKTSKALFELAGIDIAKLVNASTFETFIAELEATSNEITDQIFEYWSTNENLEIKFEIETVKNPQNPNLIEKVLDIRVRNTRHRVSLPLKNRSKGFNWFFSFIVWFSKIQSDGNKNFILLLDEPGLNLHASAQADLLRYIEDLAKEYQVIYTTHSPFMIDSNHLERVRTVYDSDAGSIISSAIQEKDPDTLFPLQAALGYDIAQNLFISKNNLLVEGPADLLYLTIISSILESEKREGLKDSITIVPIGGMDKVASFISLLRGSKLNIVCLLDSFSDQKGKQRIDDLIKIKIIKDRNVRYFDEFVKTTNGKADIEDLFEKSEYLDLFNKSFTEYKDFAVTDLDNKLPNILQQINKLISKDHFNHYRPANQLAKMSVDSKYFSKDTLNRFENMFKEINKLY